ncbi:hypothetical protein [Peribacillus huizhouensis]|uniref:L-rhamnose mutarotase n=1 Tax=Peribacillus huizhouensis TaxID=1501239 RepID=A0ABR6CWP7_9BACI|nr:hypothetical protein [Peribacillus huizhouensis]MBA9029437.1 L-rhamnose mutarotase [Peribacillus huizhouensis]
MRTEASCALNFLIYIQNIYLNQNLSKEEYKFPYFPLKVDFKEEFELKYKELWGEISQRISDHHSNGVKIFHEKKDLYFQSLFIDNKDSYKNYSEIYQTFRVWWDSLAGGFSIERSIDEKSEKLYVELANSLIQREIVPQKELNIYLVYDECLLNLEVSSYFAVLSVKDFFVKYKELVPKLQKCIY